MLFVYCIFSKLLYINAQSFIVAEWSNKFVIEYIYVNVFKKEE